MACHNLSSARYLNFLCVKNSELLDTLDIVRTHGLEQIELRFVCLINC